MRNLTRRELIGLGITGGVVGLFGICRFSDESAFQENYKTSMDSDLEKRVNFLHKAIEDSKQYKFVPISKPSDFDLMRKKPYGYYELTNDIDLEGIDFEPIGTYMQQAKLYFNGNNHTISNLKIDGTKKGCSGLFSYTEPTSVIYDLTLENPSVLGDSNIGSFVGLNNGALVNCHVADGRIEVTYYGGGLVGANEFKSNYSAIIEDCSANAFIKSRQRAGGLTGVNTGCIMNPVTNTEILSRHDSGTLVGVNRGGYIIKPKCRGKLNGESSKRLVGQLVKSPEDGMLV